MEDPTYIGAIDAFRTTGNRLHPIPVDADGPRVEVLGLLAGASAVASGLRGADLPQPDRCDDARAEHARAGPVSPRELDIRVVEDLTPDATLGVGVPPPIAAFDHEGDRVLTIGSLSKIAWGGLRIGWVRALPPGHRPDRRRPRSWPTTRAASSPRRSPPGSSRDLEAIAAQTMQVGRGAASKS